MGLLIEAMDFFRRVELARVGMVVKMEYYLMFVWQHGSSRGWGVVTGVDHIYFDVAGLYYNSNKQMCVGVYELFSRLFYFEMPRKLPGGIIVSPGQAATICAQLCEEAETLTEDWAHQFNVLHPTNDILTHYYTELQTLVHQQGGRLNFQSGTG